MSFEQSLFVQADPEKCTGCRACEVACFVRHAYSAARAKKTRTVGTVTVPVVPNLFVVKTDQVSMPVQCHHCEDAPCMKACLPGAISRVNGVVTVSARRCIGCRNCALACPFGAIEVLGAEQARVTAALFGPDALQRHEGAEKHVFKCDLCAGQDGGPACVDCCPNRALRLVDAGYEVGQKRRAALEAAPKSEDCTRRLNGGIS